jgi:hypothetical protein
MQHLSKMQRGKDENWRRLCRSDVLGTLTENGEIGSLLLTSSTDYIQRIRMYLLNISYYKLISEICFWSVARVGWTLSHVIWM